MSRDSRLARAGVDLSGVKWTLMSDQQIQVEYNGDAQYANKAIKDRVRIFTVSSNFKIEIEEDRCFIRILSRNSNVKMMQGTYVRGLENVIEGVSKLHKGSIEAIGSGYTVKLQGSQLELRLGYSNPVYLSVPGHLSVIVHPTTSKSKANATLVDVIGVDKEEVMGFIARIERIRVPDVYKVHGVRRVGKHYRKKVMARSGSK